MPQQRLWDSLYTCFLYLDLSDKKMITQIELRNKNALFRDGSSETGINSTFKIQD